MNILIVTQYFWPENFRINELAEAMSVEANITVLTGKPNYPEGRVFSGYLAWGVQREERGNIEIIRIPMFPRGSGSSFRLILNYLSFILSGCLMGPILLRKENFDMIFVYAPSPLLQAFPAILIAWLKRTPLALWVQDLWPDSLEATGFVRNRFILRLVRSTVKFIYRKSDLVLVQSTAFVEPVVELGADPRKTCYFPNPTEARFEDPVKESSAVIARLIEKMGQKFSVVYAGNVGTAQSIVTIVEAAERLARYREIQFFIIGGGSRMAWLLDEIARRSLKNISVIDRLPADEMPNVLSSASALLVTLKNEPIFNRTIPSKVQTFLAAGRPIIASMNGEGARIITEAQAGISLPAEEPISLAKAIRDISLLTEVERCRLGGNGRQYAKNHFDSRKLADDLLGRFESLRGSWGKQL